VNEAHVYAAAVDDKRMPPPESAAFEERRSMQPIGTERMNKKPRTTPTHGTPSFPTFMPPTNVMPPPWAASSLRQCFVGFLHTQTSKNKLAAQPSAAAPPVVT